MPFCPNCGTEVGENEKFCSNCGNPLQEDEKAAKKSSVQAISPKVTTSSRKTNKLIWIIVSVILIALASTYYLWSSNKTDDIQWITFTKTFGGNDDDLIFSVQQTKDGGYILVGRTESYGSGDFDGWLIKTDSKGNELWSKTFGGRKFDEIRWLQQTKDGGYILSGFTKSYSSEDFDGWLIKTDDKGKEEWSRTFGGNENDQIVSVQQTEDGGYILAGGTFTFNSGNEDGWLIRTDEKGREIWSKTFGGNEDDRIISVQQTKDGGYVLTGYTSSYGSGFDGWLIKTNEKGKEEWSKTFGEIDIDYLISVEQTNDNGYVLAGYTTSLGAGELDAWLVKTDTKGNELWSKTFGDSRLNQIYSVNQTKDEGYILTGITYSINDIMQGWLIKTDKNGEKQWSKTYGNKEGGWLRTVLEAKDGGFIIVGTINKNNKRDGWLIKTDENGNVSRENNESKSTIENYPDSF